MAQNRYLPYGYKIADGKTVINPQEAEIIRRIYKQYADGLSYLKIAQALTQEGVRYIQSKPSWNKNMVARILQNPNYLGTGKHPAIVEKSLQQAAQQMAKTYTHTEQPEIKQIKPLLQCAACGQPLKRRLKASGTERWYCPTDTEHISTSVTDDSILKQTTALATLVFEEAPQPPKEPPFATAVSTQTIRLENEIDRLLEQPQLNLAEIQSKIAELAAERYSLCKDTDHSYNAEIAHCDKMISIETLIKLTASIRLSHNKVAELILKNGKIIKEGDEPRECTTT